MKWTKVASQQFAEIFARFSTSKSRIERKELLRFLGAHHEHLAHRFEHFARHLPPGEAIKSAKAGHVCLCCKDVFVQLVSAVCKSCNKTEKGREVSSKHRSEVFKKVMNEPAVNKKKQATSLRNYGTLHPCQNKEHAAFKGRIMRSKAVQERRRQTCMSTWGVDHPSKHPKVLSKILHSFKLKKVTLKGKRFLCQGYEPFVLQRLAKVFGVKQVVSQFDPSFKSIRLEKSWYTPDFYVKSKDTYIEVKSTWTLGVKGRQDFLRQNRLKQRTCNSNGIPLKFALFLPETDKCKLLPENWFTWTLKEIRDFLHSA
jgi:hypothetical protein